MEIARQLSALGVDVIEAGFPVSSEGEKKIVKDIAKAGLEPEICGLARATRSDIDAAIECDVDTIHLFIPTSPVQMKYAVGHDARASAVRHRGIGRVRQETWIDLRVFAHGRYTI